ncbi:hypothetical protein, partial [Veillonella seminalis]|uniref:hypothetical protein n=1 Tax=Veillonella seminalis TaxID=1502943 RepID=UPI0023F4A3F5
AANAVVTPSTAVAANTAAKRFFIINYLFPKKDLIMFEPTLSNLHFRYSVILNGVSMFPHK